MLLSGKISFRAFRPPYADDVIAGLATLTEADIISFEPFRDIDSHINRVVLGVDTAFGGGSPSQTVTVEDTADQVTTDEQAEIREESTGFAGNLSGVRLAEGVGADLSRRFKDGPYKIRIRAHQRKRAIQVGEDLVVTHPRIPNPASVTPGITAKKLEVVERTEDPERGTLEFVVQDANFTRPAIWAPDSITNTYDTATASEKEYACWGPDSGNFADGGSPYEWL